jgi:hypothetical protein
MLLIPWKDVLSGKRPRPPGFFDVWRAHRRTKIRRRKLKDVAEFETWWRAAQPGDMAWYFARLNSARAIKVINPREKKGYHFELQQPQDTAVGAHVFEAARQGRVWLFSKRFELVTRWLVLRPSRAVPWHMRATRKPEDVWDNEPRVARG